MRSLWGVWAKGVGDEIYKYKGSFNTPEEARQESELYYAADYESFIKPYRCPRCP